MMTFHSNKRSFKKLKCILIYCKLGNWNRSFCFPPYHICSPSLHLHFIRDARGHLQCSVGLCVLFKGIAGENFRSNTSILQLPAHSQKTPLSVAGINPTTFRLLVSLYIQANRGRGGGWVGVGWKPNVCASVCVVEWVGVLLPQCKEHTASSPTTLWQAYIHHHPQHLCFSLLSLFIIPIPSLPPSIHPPLLPPSLSPAPISHECWCLSQLPTSLSFSLFHLLAAPPHHLSPGLPEYHLHRWCLIITPALLYLSPSSSAIGPIPAP